MKKILGISIAALCIAGMVFILLGNKKKTRNEAEEIALTGNVTVVSTMTVGKDDVSRSFTSNGVAQANRELNFVSEISGRVVEVLADKGTKVQKGTPLLKIDAELLEADYNAAKASYEALKKDEERFSRSFEAGGITNQQLDNIRTQLVAAESRLKVSKWKLDNATVKSPIAGTINNRFVETGALIAPNVPLFEIVDNSRIKVTCNVPESKVRLLKSGTRVSATANDNPGVSFTGAIKSIGVKTDRGLNYPVEILLDRNPLLHSGMYLKVHFDAGNAAGGLLIPRKAVVGSVLAANVYTVRDGKAEKRNVTLGDMQGERIEILEGLEEGDEIIVAGLMNVSDGTPVRTVEMK